MDINKFFEKPKMLYLKTTDSVTVTVNQSIMNVRRELER